MEIPSDYCGAVFNKQTKKERHRCCVPNCSTKYVSNNSFHLFPKDMKLNKLWRIKCRIMSRVPPNLFVCGSHFVAADFVHGKCNDKIRKPFLKKTAIPSQNLPISSHTRVQNIEQNKRRKERISNRNAEKQIKPTLHSDDQDSVTELEGTPEIFELITVEQALHLGVPIPKDFQEKGIQVNLLDDVMPRMNVMDLLTNENTLNGWTGLPSFALLQAIEDSVCVGFPEQMEKTNGLDISERILLCFIKLKTNLSFTCMTSIFGVTNSTISRNFNSMIPVLREIFDPIVYFPSTDEIKDNLPIAFRKYKYDTVRAILDCSEVKVQIPKCVNCKISTYSRYKSANTFKFMLTITPGGLISHVTRIYTGKASDKFIFNEEGLIELFEPHIDSLMMDKGTLIEDELLGRGLQMVRPSFFRSELGQFEEVEQIRNTRIASLRVHVERAIQRIKIFAILTDRMEYNILPQVDNIVFICAAIANLTKPILADNKF